MDAISDRRLGRKETVHSGAGVRGRRQGVIGRRRRGRGQFLHALEGTVETRPRRVAIRRDVSEQGGSRGMIDGAAPGSQRRANRAVVHLHDHVGIVVGVRLTVQESPCLLRAGDRAEARDRREISSVVGRADGLEVDVDEVFGEEEHAAQAFATRVIRKVSQQDRDAAGVARSDEAAEALRRPVGIAQAHGGGRDAVKRRRADRRK